MASFLLFTIVAAALTTLSWPALHNPNCHGFYRYFAFISIAALFSLNQPYWLIGISKPAQLASGGLLTMSLALVLNSLYLLYSRGGQRRDKPGLENYDFENTSQLVDSGIFAFIRHPMYASLLLLTWGVFLKHITVLNCIIAIFSTLSLWKTASVEEQENILFFGKSYIEYSNRTKRFIPFLL